MIIRCDNCSVSLQLDESKVPGKTFTVRCPRCQNLVRVAPPADGKSATIDQLTSNVPAPALEDGKQEFQMRESEFQINSAMKSLLMALQSEKTSLDSDDKKGEKPRRVLLCMGRNVDLTAKTLVQEGFKVYIAKTPAQANERLREGKTEILLLFAGLCRRIWRCRDYPAESKRDVRFGTQASVFGFNRRRRCDLKRT